jgi:dTDP-4-amino-4,6-dideoxygalactose transaminase
MKKSKHIPFNKTTYLGKENNYLSEAIKNENLAGDGLFTKKCHDWFEKKIGCEKALLTTSCTHAMEIAAILMDLKPNDEIIMPSFTFVSTANAFVLRGAKVVFVDIDPNTMNLDENKVYDAINPRTKAIVPIDYAGYSCNIDEINRIAKDNKLFVMVDSAQSFMSQYKNKYCGSLSPLAAYSFHATKNITSGGEGGLLLINDKKFIHQAEIIREKGTNRSKFLKGKVDKYSWINIGSSYLPSELNAAYLYCQLKHSETITKSRVNNWNYYYSSFLALAKKEYIQLPPVIKEIEHNGHIFYLKMKNLIERDRLIKFLKSKDIITSFHYVPLHSSIAGKRYGKFFGKDVFTTKESERLIRLPLFHAITKDQLDKVIDRVHDFFQ